MAVASLTSFVGDHGIYAVFALMVVAALIPAGSELVMIYAGSLAATGHVTVFGAEAQGYPRPKLLTGTLHIASVSFDKLDPIVVATAVVMMLLLVCCSRCR